MQVLLNILRGFGVQAALDAPRFCISAGSPETEGSSTGQSGDINSEVYFEEGISDDTVAKLRCAYLVLSCIQGMLIDPDTRQRWAMTRVSRKVSSGPSSAADRLSRSLTTSLARLSGPLAPILARMDMLLLRFKQRAVQAVQSQLYLGMKRL